MVYIGRSPKPRSRGPGQQIPEWRCLQTGDHAAEACTADIGISKTGGHGVLPTRRLLRRPTLQNPQCPLEWTLLCSPRWWQDGGGGTSQGLRYKIPLRDTNRSTFQNTSPAAKVWASGPLVMNSMSSDAGPSLPLRAGFCTDTGKRDWSRGEGELRGDSSGCSGGWKNQQMTWFEWAWLSSDSTWGSPTCG